MDKDFWKSKTFWGAVLLGIEAFLLNLEGSWPYVEGIIALLGTFLVVFGFRSAMK